MTLFSFDARAAIAAAGLLLASPSAAWAEPKVAADPGLVASDNALLQDDAKATAEFQRRLRAQVTYRNGVLVIIDRSGTAGGVTVMPATVMWGVDCSDAGIVVTFGAGNGDTDNGIALQVTSAGIGDDQCSRIAPTIGETLLDITKGN